MFDTSSQDHKHIEKRLAEALSGLNIQIEQVVAEPADIDLSSRDLLQMAWDRAEREIDELRTELRIMQRRHQEAERNLIARINQSKRLQQKILESAAQQTQ